MEEKKYNNFPYIKCFNLITGKYVYDVLTNTILKIKSDKLYEQVLDLNKFGFESFMNRYSKTEAADLLRLIDMGYLAPNNILAIKNPMCDMCESYAKNSINKLVLQVTQFCNLKCSYCPYAWDGDYLERSHSHKHMTWEIAKKALDLLICNSEESKELIISFYGGEPLLEKELILRCINYIKANVSSKIVSFPITTNATLLTEDFLEKIKDENVLLTFSIDGPKEIHDKNRRYGFNGKGSFDDVYNNISLVANDYPNLAKTASVNAVWDGVDDIRIINDFFHNDPIMSQLNVNINGIDDDSIPYMTETTVKNQIEQTEALYHYLYNTYFLGKQKENIDYYISSVLEGYSKLIAILKNKEPLQPQRFHNGPCIPGHSKLFVDVNGELYPCEKATDKILKFGNLDSFDFNTMRHFMNTADTTSENCKNCWAFRFCGSCVVNCANKDVFSKKLMMQMCNSVKGNMVSDFKDLIYLYELGINFTEREEISK